MRKLRKVLRYGLLMQRILSWLRSHGLDIHPFCLIREGVRAYDLTLPDLAGEFESTVLTQDEIPAIAALSPWATVENVQGRFDRGDLCLVLKNEETVAGYTWVNFEEVSEPKCSYVLQPGEAYLYDAYIAPDYRGRDLAPYMRYECYKHLRNDGRDAFYSLSDYFNKPAIRFKVKLNAEIVRLYLYMAVGSREIGHWTLKNYER